MDSLDTQDTHVLDAARKWAAAGHRFALITVARTWGSAPRPPGAWMILRDDGQVQGSVSGGCIEDDLIRRAAAGEFTGESGNTAPHLLRYGVTADEAHRFGLPCGGTLELVLEPAPDAALLEQLARRIGTGQLARRRVELATGSVSIEGGRAGESLLWDGETLVTLHGPAWRLLIIGAGQISRYLATMAQALGYRVYICDPRSEYADGWDVPGTERIAAMPDDAVTELGLDPRSAVVALTHDPKLDDLALLEALKSPAFYVGALGSQANSSKRRERLLHYFDLSQAEVERLHGPVGLPIGSRTPPEIAVSILAEMTALKNGQNIRLAAEAADPYACRVA
ncbi:MAG: XdhC family protein [Propionivibrio sp.]|uniref:XdhC family protein n=1 Tax=Candidatus Propionivibrio dominans TaxID=2954373 RepID=A0A9D7FCF3_9RHOO|nr:XdhC family protein [Candidatus Propionivibrio dominans]